MVVYIWEENGYVIRLNTLLIFFPDFFTSLLFSFCQLFIMEPDVVKRLHIIFYVIIDLLFLYFPCRNYVHWYYLLE